MDGRERAPRKMEQLRHALLDGLSVEASCVPKTSTHLLHLLQLEDALPAARLLPVCGRGRERLAVASATGTSCWW